MEQDNSWTISLTTPFDLTLRLSTVLKMYLLFLMIPAMYALISHMYKARKQKIGPRSPKKARVKKVK